MKVITLYKYIRPDGGVTISPIQPDCDYVQMIRMIADENKILVKDGYMTECIDADTSDGWTEVDMPNEPIEE